MRQEMPLAQKQMCRDRPRIFERMRRIRVEESATIRAQHLDCDLRCDRTNRNGLFAAFERRRIDISDERLRHSLPDQEQRQDDGNRQEHV